MYIARSSLVVSRTLYQRDACMSDVMFSANECFEMFQFLSLFVTFYLYRLHYVSCLVLVSCVLYLIYKYCYHTNIIELFDHSTSLYYRCVVLKAWLNFNRSCFRLLFKNLL